MPKPVTAVPPFNPSQRNERRKARRVAANLPCDLRERRLGVACQTLDVSVGGALLRHSRAPEPGARRRFSLRMPDSLIPIICEAEILPARDASHTVFPVRFLDLSARDWIRLATFMRER